MNIAFPFVVEFLNLPQATTVTVSGPTLAIVARTRDQRVLRYHGPIAIHKDGITREFVPPPGAPLVGIQWHFELAAGYYTGSTHWARATTETWLVAVGQDGHDRCDARAYVESDAAISATIVRGYPPNLIADHDNDTDEEGRTVLACNPVGATVELNVGLAAKVTWDSSHLSRIASIEYQDEHGSWHRYPGQPNYRVGGRCEAVTNSVFDSGDVDGACFLAGSAHG